MDRARAKSMVRIVESKRWQAKRVQLLKATPVTEKPHALDVIETSVGPHAGNPVPDDVHIDDDTATTKRIRLSLADLRRYTFTPGCAKCTLHRLGDHVRAGHARHSESCHARIYVLMRNDQIQNISDGDSQGRTTSKSNTQTAATKPQPIPSTSPQPIHAPVAFGPQDADGLPDHVVDDDLPDPAVDSDALLSHEDYTNIMDVLQLQGG